MNYAIYSQSVVINKTVHRKLIWLNRSILGVSLGLFLAATGCVSSKKIVYFQSDTDAGNTVQMAAPYVPTIKVGDVLSIQVNSLNPEATTFFNPYAPMTLASGRTAQPTNTNGLPPIEGYLVSPDGEIELPLIELIQAKGLTVTQLKEKVRQKLQTYLKEPTVNIRNLNFRISVLGEVVRPSLFTVPNDQITLIEAISLAGDATIYGRRDNVLVVREENGQKTFARIDITKRNLFRSPYYYLHPNDIVYVEPGKARVSNADQFYQLVPAILSALSFLAIIITRRN
ncbi:polysaccharide biosynthesis/export family protein [Spirosoma utsteinense]|uniref:Polysaccharide export outer membrane protein n=1 Tax=Spirosoma utsteinense TaxID=2585773 RepID=A0ABR6W7V0_9BACT|nr:polysaccharide biosynthesis/export family protein [Spirosoma utsteinense]MBC3792587.1 polysaccharide export outer membrane protein [Spirosoma utsteinense]